MHGQIRTKYIQLDPQLVSVFVFEVDLRVTLANLHLGLFELLQVLREELGAIQIGLAASKSDASGFTTFYGFVIAPLNPVVSNGVRLRCASRLLILIAHRRARVGLFDPG